MRLLHLTIVMGVRIDKARRHQQTARLALPRRLIRDFADGGNLAGIDCDVSFEGIAAAAV